MHNFSSPIFQFKQNSKISIKCHLIVCLYLQKENDTRVDLNANHFLSCQIIPFVHACETKINWFLRLKMKSIFFVSFFQTLVSSHQSLYLRFREMYFFPERKKWKHFCDAQLIKMQTIFEVAKLFHLHTCETKINLFL